MSLLLQVVFLNDFEEMSIAFIDFRYFRHFIVPITKVRILSASYIPFIQRKHSDYLIIKLDIYYCILLST